MRYLVRVEKDNQLHYCKSFKSESGTLGMANEWLDRANIHDHFDNDDIHHVRLNGPMTIGPVNGYTVTIMREIIDEYSTPNGLVSNVDPTSTVYCSTREKAMNPSEERQSKK